MNDARRWPPKFKPGALVRSADSGRMGGLKRIPTIKRRERAVRDLMRKAW